MPNKLARLEFSTFSRSRRGEFTRGKIVPLNSSGVRTMSDFDYLTGRLENQIEWYDQKSVQAKRRFYFIQTVQLLAAASIPVLAAFTVDKAILGILGAVAATAVAFGSLGAFQTLWIRYRATAEALKHEKYLYLSAAEPYSDPQSKTQTLARQCETIVSSEHSMWAARMKKIGRTTD